MRTPSMTKAMITPRNRIQPEKPRSPGVKYAATARTATMMSLPNMDPPLEACEAASMWTLGAWLGGDFDRVSICARYINHGAGLERLRAVDARVPARAAIAHSRQARGGIDPLLEARRHARVDRRHLRRAVLGPV